MSDRLAQRLRLLGVAGVAAPAAMILAGFLLSWRTTRQLPDLLRLPAGRDLLLGALTGCLSLGLLALLHRSSERFERALRESGTRVGQEALAVAGYPVMLVVVTMAGLGEEVLFRGGLQPIIGILPAAFLFGVSHGGWRREMWAYAVAATASGSLFGLAYRLTGEIWVPVIAHALHNVASVALLGKRVELSWEGRWPSVRLLPETAEPPAETPAGPQAESASGLPAEPAAAPEAGPPSAVSVPPAVPALPVRVRRIRRRPVRLRRLPGRMVTGRHRVRPRLARLATRRRK